jgi:serine protease AprX
MEVALLIALRSDFSRIRWGTAALASAALLFVLMLAAAKLPTAALSRDGESAATQAVETKITPSLSDLADRHPQRRAELIVQLDAGTKPAAGRELVRSLGGRVTGELPIIHGLAARMSAGAAQELAGHSSVKAVSLNAAVKRNAIDSSQLVTSYPASVQAPKAWSAGGTGKGVGVAVVDTGIAGDLADFRKSQTDTTSREIASVVTNPSAKTDQDGYGHGTHVAGIIAGNSNSRPSSDSLRGDYVGVAPEANLINVKVSDEKGGATVLDVIYGLQFVVDFKDAYNIRVVNLSLESTDAQSYKTDPLDAAAESAWFHGIVVVAAAGNRGTASDAVDYAPGNDPYVISVGAVDDQGTKNSLDDALASWSSRGTTQDGHAKPDILAPGAHIVSNLAPQSEFASMCPTCVVSGQYIRAGGTSMAAPMVAGTAAVLLQLHPELTPNQVKGTIAAATRQVLGVGVDEVSVVSLLQGNLAITTANQGLTPNTLVSSSTGAIDYTRSSWSRSSWSRSSWSRSSWSRSSWSCNCSKTSSGAIDPTRSSWSRSSWSTSWSK